MMGTCKNDIINFNILYFLFSIWYDSEYDFFFYLILIYYINFVI